MAAVGFEPTPPERLELTSLLSLFLSFSLTLSLQVKTKTRWLSFWSSVRKGRPRTRELALPQAGLIRELALPLAGLIREIARPLAVLIMSRTTATMKVPAVQREREYKYSNKNTLR